MGYRIRYERLKKREWSGLEVAAVQAVAAVALLAVICAVKRWVPSAEAALAAYLGPPEDSASAAMAQVLEQGGGLRSGLVAMCRQILEAAGYGA